jgi:Hint domain
MTEHTTLARRHLLTALSIGAAALLSKAALAQPVPPPIEDDSIYWPPLQQIPPSYYEWEDIARGIGHCQSFYGTPYPQSDFDRLIGSYGPPAKGVLDPLNASPAQAGAPLGIPAGKYTFNYPGYSPSGPSIEDNSLYWPPLQQIPPWYYVWEDAYGRGIAHYQSIFGAYPQSNFNNLVNSIGPPPEGILDTINASPAQKGAPLGIPAGNYTFDYPGYGRGGCFRRGTPIRMANGERAVEDLAIGDLVVTAHRGLQPVQAIERSAHNRAVRVARSALADDVPYRDLYVTEEHALLIDGLFVTAGSLGNGTTIDYANKQSEYFHIELPIYDAVYAVGLACESYIAQRTVMGLRNSRQRMASHLRSAVAPWWDIRRPVDVVRSRIEERALSL